VCGRALSAGTGFIHTGNLQMDFVAEAPVCVDRLVEVGRRQHRLYSNLKAAP